MFPHEILILCPDLHESHMSRVRWTHVRLMQLRLMAIPCGKFEIQSRLQSTKVDYIIGRAVNAGKFLSGKLLTCRKCASAPKRNNGNFTSHTATSRKIISLKLRNITKSDDPEHFSSSTSARNSAEFSYISLPPKPQQIEVFRSHPITHRIDLRLRPVSIDLVCDLGHGFANFDLTFAVFHHATV